MRPKHRAIIVVLILTFLICCKSVWIHPEWEEGKYEADIGDCAKQPNWKLCMVARGWHSKGGSCFSQRSGLHLR